MSVSRTVASPLRTIFRFSSPPLRLSASSCPHCSRPFSSPSIARQSSKRLLQTATAYRPQNLEQSLPPPRNAGTPESSIAGGIPRVDFGSSSRISVSKDSSHDTTAARSRLVEEADEDRTTNRDAASTSQVNGSSQPAPAKPRKSRLRPRKAAMTLTPKAVSQLQQLLDQPEPKLIRVGVKNRGCSGLAYHLEYVDKPGAFDESVEQDGVKVLIDSKALFSIIGSEMDWIEDKLNERFIFRNPNITEQCGCGESFSIS